ncbi:MAG TPA: glucoamylase family protein [Sphingomonas sp.]|jgi:hypothetical protein|nr:glucoamylase family protein [Sphingomonas sp.]
MVDRRAFLSTAGLGFAGLVAGCVTSGSGPQSGGAFDLIADVQERTFRFFWETTDPQTGLAPDRWPTPSFTSIAAVGFALTAYPVGVTRRWISRDQARARTLATLRFFADAAQGDGATGVSGYKGFFYHFLGTTNGQRFARCELSSIDTALLIGGALFAQSWFDGDHPDEAEIRRLADQLYLAVEWDWMMPRPPFVAMGWHPEDGFIRSDWNIYNEAMLLYVMALASPTHAIAADTWPKLTARFADAWTENRGRPHLHFSPLFGHQYSHMWIDFRGIRDPFIASKGIDYFENSRRATIAQRDYAVANPGRFAGYGPDIWGLTACDGPGDFTRTIGGTAREFYSYSARGPGDRDDGTLAPTAALGSIAFAPELVVPAATAMHARYGRGIYGRYGFLDSFNPTLTDALAPLQHGKIVPCVGWVDSDYLGIDQGPILGGIENWRSGMIWATMRRNPHIRCGLQRAGFTGGWLS